ncbi:MAG TPA: DCC1-like thiol-disulfide oxidoreductase family protein [Bdellovibrio sp.]
MEKVNVQSRNVVFFDGVCHLCNGFVDAVISRDKGHVLSFAPLQGSTAKELLPASDLMKLDTVIFYEGGKIHHRSSAILKILTKLGGRYTLFGLGWIIPGFLRDLLYKWIAKNRYAWFGERNMCRFPTPAERSYLLD